MYIPAHFAAGSAEVDELLARHGAADLITLTQAGLLATMLPFVYEPEAGEHGALHGHLARNNDQWREPALGESLAIVRGPDAYVSPSWYAAKAEHGRVVPTWNYVTAHVYGRLVVHDDPRWVEDLVRRLTAKHEAARMESPGQAPPWSVDDAPRPFVEGQLRAIVGVELQITRIQAKAKLSQNRPVGDIAGVVAGLTARGDARSATAVARANEHRANEHRGLPIIRAVTIYPEVTRTDLVLGDGNDRPYPVARRHDRLPWPALGLGAGLRPHRVPRGIAVPA
jgi:transcriptional regulator